MTQSISSIRIVSPEVQKRIMNISRVAIAKAVFCIILSSDMVRWIGASYLKGGEVKVMLEITKYCYILNQLYVLVCEIWHVDRTLRIIKRDQINDLRLKSLLVIERKRYEGSIMSHVFADVVCALFLSFFAWNWIYMIVLIPVIGQVIEYKMMSDEYYKTSRDEGRDDVEETYESI